MATNGSASPGPTRRWGAPGPAQPAGEAVSPSNDFDLGDSIASGTAAAETAAAAPVAAPPKPLPHDPGTSAVVRTARTLQPAARVVDLRARLEMETIRMKDVTSRMGALDVVSVGSALAIKSRERGVEDLREEYTLLERLSNFYRQKIEEASDEPSELDKIERILSGNAVPNGR